MRRPLTPQALVLGELSEAGIKLRWSAAMRSPFMADLRKMIEENKAGEGVGELPWRITSADLDSESA